ncbi:Magnesium transporter MgtE [bacterium HR10]|nr:Magnesium transporter MgtE [bacterium HR10]
MAYLRKLDLAIESARKLARIGASTNLVNLLRKMRPADVAVIFGNLTDGERLFALRSLLKQDGDFVASTLSEMPPEEAASLLAHLEPETIADLLQKIPVDDATQITSKLPPELVERVLELMHVARSVDVVDQLQFEENTAGRIMNPHVFALHEDMTVGEAISTLQRKSDELEMVFYLYVVDDRHHLVGVVSLRQLLLNPPSTPLRKIMSTDVISVHTSTDQEEVARVVSKYDLMAVPVVDDENRLVGIVTVDDVIDVLQEELTEDYFRMVGSDAAELERRTPTEIARLRLPWLLMTVLIELIAGAVIHRFDDTLGTVILLASFMPVIQAISGNTGLQSATIVVRGLATGHISLKDWWRPVARQLRTTLILGGILGALIFFVGGLWHGWQRMAERGTWFDPVFGFVVGFSMFVAINLSGFVGTVIPMISKRLGFDPALTAGPFETAFQDVVSVTIMLGLATLLLQWMA